MNWKIDFSWFGKVNKAVAMALELKKYYALYESLQTLIPLALECKKAVEIPLRNLLLEFRKKVAEAEAVAAGTENKADDAAMKFLAAAADKLLELFHAADDYQKLSALDKAVQPK